MTIFSRREFLHYFKMIWAFLLPTMPRFLKAEGSTGNSGKVRYMRLPTPKLEGLISLEEAIQRRRTVRNFKKHKAITIEQYSQLMWASQGITEFGGYKRASPSAGALYPMDLYGVIGTNGVHNINTGVYHYLPEKHSIELISTGDVLDKIAEASLFQMWMAKAPINIIITSEYSRITGKYGNRGIRYAHMEAGNISQNIFLQAEALGLKAGIVGAFNNKLVNRTINVPTSHEPLLIMPVGFKA